MLPYITTEYLYIAHFRHDYSPGISINVHRSKNYISIPKESWKAHIFSQASNTWWRHQMETYSASLTLWEGNSSVNSPHKGQWRGALMFSLICAWIKADEAADLRRNRAHYDAIAMIYLLIIIDVCYNICYKLNHIHLVDDSFDKFLLQFIL